jgi:hypothetical protein
MSQREVTDNKALENHGSAVMTSGQPPGSFGHQRVLAHTAIFVDLFIDGRIGVSPVWGPLVPFMEGHLVAVEFVSDWLSKKMLIRYIAEAQLLLHNEQEGDPGPDDGRLIIICHDMPRARLAELAEHITPGPMPGIWQFNLAGAGSAIICAANLLPDQPGNSCLRFAVAKPPHAEHLQRLFAVARDTTIPEHLRIEAIRSTYMLDEARSHFSELPIWHDILAELGRQTPRILAEQRADAVKEGVAQGVAQGVDKAVEDLLAAAAAHLPAETIEELRLQRDPVAIALAMAGAAR